MRINPETKLADGRKLLAWWANNRGRGSDNCSLAIVDGDDKRETHAAKQNAYAHTRTSSWAGDVNLSTAVLKRLGISKNQII